MPRVLSGSEVKATPLPPPSARRNPRPLLTYGSLYLRQLSAWRRQHCVHHGTSFRRPFYVHVGPSPWLGPEPRYERDHGYYLAMCHYADAPSLLDVAPQRPRARRWDADTLLPQAALASPRHPMPGAANALCICPAVLGPPVNRGYEGPRCWQLDRDPWLLRG